MSANVIHIDFRYRTRTVSENALGVRGGHALIKSRRARAPERPREHILLIRWAMKKSPHRAIAPAN